MNKKIISIAMTLFMLILCVILMVTFRTINIKRNLDINTNRADQSVLSIDGEVTDGVGANVSGASIISSVKHASSREEYNRYIIKLGETVLTPDNVETNISSNSQYTLRYTESGSSIIVSIEVGV